MTEKQRDLCIYRLKQAEETVQSAKLCKNNHFYKDAINRAYYAAFYAVKAVLAIEGIDFKRHKDVVAYFNQHYVATEMFSKECGRTLARLQRKREVSDYDDFYIASVEEAQEQIEVASNIIAEVKKYLGEKGII
ncbi:MAG: HEPN domain-containing protein [Lachnospiraceae bacterium]|nr:HEPN domain-containing protein [Lachnospiraceae bacterium]